MALDLHAHPVLLGRLRSFVSLPLRRLRRIMYDHYGVSLLLTAFIFTEYTVRASSGMARVGFPHRRSRQDRLLEKTIPRRVIR